MSKTARLDIRTTEEAKVVIENAAKYLGTTTSAFVLETVMEKAIRTLQQAQNIQLNAEKHRRFLSVLENPPEPNKNLKRLFKKHKSDSK